MGLLYIMPIDLDEVDRIRVNEESLLLKSYGLPLIFWGYLAAVLVVIFAMGIAILAPLQKLFETGDPLNQALVIMCALTLIGVPLGFIFLFFLEIRLEKKKDILKKSYHLLGLPFFYKKIQLDNQKPFEIVHHMDSPNIAKLDGDEELRGFQNKGYFVLIAINKNDKRIWIDRSSRKVDLVKLKGLLEKY
jgi:hypothetical protein